MNTQHQPPMTMLVHHELSWPLNWIRLWIRAEDEDAEQGAQDVAAAAGQQGPADDHRRDDRQLHAHRVQPVTGPDVDAVARCPASAEQNPLTM